MRSITRLGLALGVALALAGPAAAEVAAVAPDGFTIKLGRTVKAPPAAAFAALLDWGRWWSGGHSYSGDAGNIKLDPHAGGCLCERWAGGEVAHGRVLMIVPGRLLRLDAPLGPLQPLPGGAVLTFVLDAAGSGTRIGIVFQAAGSARDRYDNLGGPVDTVLALHADRLARLIDTGAP